MTLTGAEAPTGMGRKMAKVARPEREKIPGW
jgi:hypothetical protein